MQVQCDLRIDVDRSTRETVLIVGGEIDISNAQGLERVIDIALGNGGDVVVDMESVEFFGSDGARVLAACVDHAGSRGARLVVRNPRPVARKVIEILALESVLTIEDRTTST